jgi:hypothetical protein
MMRGIGLGLVLATLGACGGNDGGGGTWKATVVLEAPDKLSGCAIGDLDPRRPGNEIAAVCGNGEVYVVHRDGDAWKKEVVAHTPGEPIQCAVGDTDPAREGAELVVVGMAAGTEDSGGAGAAHLIWWDGHGWKRKLLFEDTALIHGVCIGDLDAARAGQEILLVGFSNRATMLFREEGAWISETAADLGSAGKTAVPYRGGAAVACNAGTVVHVRKTGGRWSSEVLDRAEAGQSRIGTDGRRLLVARDDGALGLIGTEGRTDIHKEGQKLRGAVLADLDPGAAGIEAATAGYEGTITVLYPEDDAWRAEIVFRDTGRFHHLVAGELLTAGEGPELAGCGYSRRLTVVVCR